jgi:cytochrome oxidase Cu insertion factor (SCO1/SenC/PrrC family)
VLVNFFSSGHEEQYRIMKNLAEVAKRLDKKVGSEVFINSVSLDPEYDTFERLQQLADELQAPDGWCFVRATENANKELMGRMNRLRGYMSRHLVFYGKPGAFWGTFPGHNSPDELADRIARSVPGPRPAQWRRAGPAKRGHEPRPWTAREVV